MYADLQDPISLISEMYKKIENDNSKEIIWANRKSTDNGFIEKIIQIIVCTVIYFSITYSVLEVTFKKKETRDERDDMINSKSYKLGYLLYELSLFIFIGYVCSKFQNKELLNLTGNHELYNSFQLTDGGIVFFILVLLAFISVIKSLYQFYLYRTV